MDGPRVGENDRTIRDFGEQWSHYDGNEGFYGSLELFQDMFGPLLEIGELKGARVADIGSGTGRIVKMLVDAGVRHVVAVEPSGGVEALRINTREFSDKVEIIHGSGEEVPPGRDLDFVLAVGVIQFIVDPLPTLRAAYDALRPGGRLFLWVYAKEGNGFYVALVSALRQVTLRLPHAALDGLCSLLTVLVDIYIAACRWLPLPMRDYMRNTLARVSRENRKLTIYDQLNPRYVRYHRADEVRELFESAGFCDVRLHHRRGYSWSALGVKPA
jgi:SAM-dependent methyltransferase